MPDFRVLKNRSVGHRKMLDKAGFMSAACLEAGYDVVWTSMLSFIAAISTLFSNRAVITTASLVFEDATHTSLKQAQRTTAHWVTEQRH